MTGGGPVDASNTMAVYMINHGFKRFEFGYASAVAVIMLMISLRDRDHLSALRPAPRPRGRHDHDGTVSDGHRRHHHGPRRPGATGRRVRRIGARTALYVIAWIAAIATLVPIVYAILGGFRDTGQLSSNPVALPDPWVFSNYSENPQVRRRSGTRSGTAS